MEITLLKSLVQLTKPNRAELSKTLRLDLATQFKPTAHCQSFDVANINLTTTFEHVSHSRPPLRRPPRASAWYTFRWHESRTLFKTNPLAFNSRKYIPTQIAIFPIAFRAALFSSKWAARCRPSIQNCSSTRVLYFTSFFTSTSFDHVHSIGRFNLETRKTTIRDLGITTSTSLRYTEYQKKWLLVLIKK